MKKNLIHTLIPAALLVLSVAASSFLFLGKMKDFDLIYLIALVVLFAATVVLRNHFNRPLVITARTLIGALFIFSGFVKGVDPLGTQYQMEDYFVAYGTEWANPLAFGLSIFMILAEFTVGVALILNVRTKLAVWGAILMMAFFTITTFYDAFAVMLFGAKQDPVADCGCFGKAITLTNFQTFYKNVILDTLLVILFFGRYRIRNTFNFRNEAIITSAVIVLFLGFQFYNLRHLPVIDFMDWKKGAQLNPPKTQAVSYICKYKNKITNEIQEFDLKDAPAADTENWEFVETLINDPNPKNLMIPFFDAAGTDMASFIAEVPDYYFIVAMHDLEKAKLKNMSKIFDLQDFARKNGYEFVFLFSSGIDEQLITDFKTKVGREDLDIYFSDDKNIKAIVRSNPGLVLLKNGFVIDKWAWRDIPSLTETEEIVKIG